MLLLSILSSMTLGIISWTLIMTLMFPVPSIAINKSIIWLGTPEVNQEDISFYVVDQEVIPFYVLIFILVKSLLASITSGVLLSLIPSCIINRRSDIAFSDIILLLIVVLPPSRSFLEDRR